MATGPRTTRRLPGGVAALLAALLVGLAGAAGLVEVQTQQAPSLATAVTADGRNLNLEIRDGVATVSEPVYDERGHAPLPSWRAELPGGLALPTAPVMRWPVDFARAAARGERPLRTCYDELTAHDAELRRAGLPAQSEQAARAAMAELTGRFVLETVEDCARPDFVFGPTAGRDCAIGRQAWGCASVQGRGAETFVRITHNGEEYRDGRMRYPAVLGVYYHEIKHGLDRGHTQVGHDHPTDLTPMCGPDTLACGNPGPGMAFEDFDGGGGRENNIGLRERVATPEPPVEQPWTARATVTVAVWDPGKGDFDYRDVPVEWQARPGQAAWFRLVVPKGGGQSGESGSDFYPQEPPAQ